MSNEQGGGENMEAGRLAQYGSRIDLPVAKDVQLAPASGLNPIIRDAIDTHKLITPEGIKASSAMGPYARVFGRDTLVTTSLFLKTRQYGEDYVDNKTLVSAMRPLISNIATEDNKELGIRSGAVPHEMGTLAEGFPKDWEKHVKDGTGVLYDTADATGRAMLVISELAKENPDDLEVQKELLPAMVPMTKWAIANSNDHDGLIGFTGAEYDDDRIKSGAKGLTNHTWQDCGFSIVDHEGQIPKHPIKPVEEQALTWAALHESADRLQESDPALSREAREAADKLKKTFNEKFVYTDDKGVYLARAIDGDGNQIRTINIDALIALGYVYDGKSILEDEDLTLPIIRRSMDELYSPVGGLRTQSSNGLIHEGNTYHGDTAYWPHAQTMAAIALEATAERVKNTDDAKECHYYATEAAKGAAGLILYFKSPVELAVISDTGDIDVFKEIKEDGTPQESTRWQAWAAGSAAWLEGFLQSRGEEIPVPV